MELILEWFPIGQTAYRLKSDDERCTSSIRWCLSRDKKYCLNLDAKAERDFHWKFAEKLLALTVPKEERPVLLLVCFNFEGIVFGKDSDAQLDWRTGILPLLEEAIRKELVPDRIIFTHWQKQGPSL